VSLGPADRAVDEDVVGTAVAELLRAAADGRRALLDDGPDLDAIEAADAEAFVAQAIETGLQLVGVDPARPALAPWQTPTRRYMDNGPESVYHFAFVDDRHTYRVRGRREGECYLSVSLYAMDSGQPDRQVMSVNHHDLGAGPGDDFSIDIAPRDGGSIVLTRQYFLDPLRDAAGPLAIEVVDGPEPETDAEPAGAATGEGWRRAARCVSALTSPFLLGDPLPPWVSAVPNTLGDPSGWETDPVAGRSAHDQIYASGPFELADDEALVLDVRFPQAAYASVTLWTRFRQSVDARFHRSTLNPRSALADEDGVVRAVVAARDPGVANWLDTGGRRRGTIFCRYLLPEEPTAPITTRVVRIDDL
jgi:hypothetical protein